MKKETKSDTPAGAVDPAASCSAFCGVATYEGTALKADWNGRERIATLLNDRDFAAGYGIEIEGKGAWLIARVEVQGALVRLHLEPNGGAQLLGTEE